MIERNWLEIKQLPNERVNTHPLESAVLKCELLSITLCTVPADHVGTAMSFFL